MTGLEQLEKTMIPPMFGAGVMIFVFSYLFNGLFGFLKRDVATGLPCPKII